jgi:hypothetical protein
VKRYKNKIAFRSLVDVRIINSYIKLKQFSTQIIMNFSIKFTISLYENVALGQLAIIHLDFTENILNINLKIARETFITGTKL